MSEVSFGLDGDYSEMAMLACCNGFLANNLGNLQNRVMSLVFKNCDKQVPEIGPLMEEDEKLLATARALRGEMQPLVDQQAMNKVCDKMADLARAANKYIDDTAPWVLKKSDPERMRTVLWVLMETLRHVGVCTQPLMPVSATKMLDQLGVPEDARNFAALDDPANAIQAGTPVSKPVGLFPRIELEVAA